jgi:hypothetical protein
VDGNSDNEDARCDENNKAGRHKVEAMDGSERLNKHWCEPEAMGEGMGKLRCKDTNSDPGVEPRWDVGGVHGSSLTMWQTLLISSLLSEELVTSCLIFLLGCQLGGVVAHWHLWLKAVGHTIDESVNKSGERCDEVVLAVGDQDKQHRRIGSSVTMWKVYACGMPTH